MDNFTAARRSLARRLLSLGLSVGLAVAGLLLLGRWAGGAAASGLPAAPSRPSAVTFTVTNSYDAPDTNPGDTFCEAITPDPDPTHRCTLRAAVQELNAGAGGTIQLQAITYTLNYEAGGDLQLQKDMTIQPPVLGQSTIQGNPAGWNHRILRVQSGARVVLSRLVISGGNVPNLAGGGIDVVSGTLFLFGDQVTHNKAALGGGVYNGGIVIMTLGAIDANTAYTAGAGLYNNTSITTGINLNIDDGEILANNVLSATGEGAGLYNLGHATIKATTIAQNRAHVKGGGVENAGGGTLAIQTSTFDQNYADIGDGGGLFNGGASSEVEIVNSTFNGNTASLNGGALANESAGVIDLSNVTVAANSTSAPGAGGGLYNSGAAFTLRNSLVGQNSNFSGTKPDCSGTFDSQDYNLLQNTTGCTLINNTTHNVPPQDPKLGTFGLFGGQTAVWTLQVMSPAVDGGNPGGCRDSHNTLITNDQRSSLRPLDGNNDGSAICDIGAYELALVRTFLPLVRR